MRLVFYFVVLNLLLVYSATCIAAKLVEAKNGSGIVGYKDTPILPWCGYHVHDPDRPAPRQVEPGRRRGASSRRGTMAKNCCRIARWTLVGVAQSVEHWIVVPAVVGSSPIAHPRFCGPLAQLVEQ